MGDLVTDSQDISGDNRCEKACCNEKNDSRDFVHLAVWNGEVRGKKSVVGGKGGFFF